MGSRVRNSQNIFMELRKVCQHPYLAAPELENQALVEKEQHRLLWQTCGKLAFLKILLPKLKERGHRVLLFSQFKIALNEIQNFLIGEGYNCLRIDGDVQQAHRQKSIDAFNAPDSEYFIFLITTRAGGVGINLATADTVIVYDPDFNPHQDLQAIARSHRYGQTKKVLVFKLMTKDSIEEQIVYNGKKKMVLDHLVVQNLGKENDEEDVSSMLLSGAKALYNTNDDGTSASDVIYTSKQVDEMIDKVEEQAEQEALLLQDKWAKEDNMTEEEKLLALNTKGVETMDFSFAKIWEMDKGDLQEVEEDPALEERLVEEMDENWMTVWGAAEKERQRKEAADLARDKSERRKKIDYAIDDTTPKKNKLGRPKGKGKGKEGEVSLSRAQSSGSEFNFQDDEISDADSSDREVNIDGGDLPQDPITGTTHHDPITGFTHHGQLKSRVKELRNMETQALKRKFEEAMLAHAQSLDPVAAIAEVAAIAAALNTIEPPHPDGIIPSQNTIPSENSQSSSGPPGETPAQRFARKELKRIKKLAQHQERLDLENRARQAQAQLHGIPHGPLIPSVPGPSGSNGPAFAPTVPHPPNSHAPFQAGPSMDQIEPSTTTTHPPSGPMAEKSPALIQMARSASNTALIASAQDIIKWLWHALQEMGMKQEIKLWAKMVLPEVPPAERKGIYWELARDVDNLLSEAGHDRYFSEPQHRPALEMLFNERAPGCPTDPQRVVPPAPAKGVGRLKRGHPKDGTIGNARASDSAAAGPSNGPPTYPELMGEMNTSTVQSTLMPINGVNGTTSQKTPAPLIARPATTLTIPQRAAAQARTTLTSDTGVGVQSLPVQARPAVAQPTNGSTIPHTPQAGPSHSLVNDMADGVRPTAPANPSSTRVHPEVEARAKLSYSLLLPGKLPSANGYNGLHIDPPTAALLATGTLCLLCLQRGHSTPLCPPDITPPETTLQVLLAARQEELKKPGTSQYRRYVVLREMREIFRRQGVRKKILDNLIARPTAPQAQVRPPGIPQVSVPTQPEPQPTFGMPMPKRRKVAEPAQAAPSTSTSTTTWAQPNLVQSSSASASINPPIGHGSGTPANRPGGTQADAIAIDDDDEDAVRDSVPPTPPAAASIAAPAATANTAASSSVGKCTTCGVIGHAHEACPLMTADVAVLKRILTDLPADHPKVDVIQGLYDKHVAAKRCPMCRKDCGLDIRNCAEAQGGRKELKDRIKKLNATATKDGQPDPSLVRLYECYQAWPREDTPRKVKREAE